VPSSCFSIGMNHYLTRDTGNDILLSANTTVAADTCSTTARLYSTASTKTTGTFSSSPLVAEVSSTLSSWVYESGATIETESLIISRHMQDFTYGGLNQ
jgi:hypothetical protein